MKKTIGKRVTPLTLSLVLGLTIFSLAAAGGLQPVFKGASSQASMNAGASSKGAAANSKSKSVDKAYLQAIWNGWATLDASGQKQFYAQGPHVFFDDEPLKFSSWDEYQATTSKELAEYKSGRFTVNDDAQIHKSGEIYWVTATVASDLTQKSGKREETTFRWTAIFEQQNGKWLIVHEHVSVPAQQ